MFRTAFNFAAVLFSFWSVADWACGSCHEGRTLSNSGRRCYVSRRPVDDGNRRKGRGVRCTAPLFLTFTRRPTYALIRLMTVRLATTNNGSLSMSRELSRLYELDSLRALAAIGVIGWYYTNHFGASPIPYLMAPFYRHGLLLVDFFFVLSGFVLARVYWNDKRSVTLANNVRDRIARMYPLHFTTLCAVAIMQWTLVNHLPHRRLSMYSMTNMISR